MIDPRYLDGLADYCIDGLGAGRWRFMWRDGAEAAFHSRSVRALVRLDDLTEIEHGHLRLD